MPDPSRRIHFLADRGDARLRLDQVLVRRVTQVTRMSRAQAQAWIAAGAVRLDGVPAARPAATVREGMRVEIDLPASATLRLEPAPEARAIDVLYEDEHLLAVNKPPGVVVHPSYKHPSGTILNAVLGRIPGGAAARPGIVTRLDKDTSGVLLVALTPGVHARLQRRPVRKEYLAIVAGTPRPAAGTIDLALARDPRDRRRMMVSNTGAPSATRYEVRASGGGLSLVRCELLTGRTHQIRVHLAAKGWPIAGDAVYGVADDRVPRLGLHAWRVCLEHPVTGAPLEIVAPMPDDLARRWES